MNLSPDGHRFALKKNALNEGYFCGSMHCKELSLWATLIRGLFSLLWGLVIYFHFSNFNSWFDYVLLICCGRDIILDTAILLCYLICQAEHPITLNLVIFTWNNYLVESVAFLLICVVWFITPTFIDISSNTIFRNIYQSVLRGEIALNEGPPRAHIALFFCFGLVFILFSLFGWTVTVVFKLYLTQKAKCETIPFVKTIKK